MDQPIIQSTVCNGVFKQLCKQFPEAELLDLPYCVRCDAPRKSKADLCRFKGDRNLFQFLLGFVHLFLRRFPPIYITRRHCHMVNSHCFTGLHRHAVAAKLESSMRSRYIMDISSKSSISLNSLMLHYSNFARRELQTSCYRSCTQKKYMKASLV
jgi:hypothetical protein